VLTRLLANGQEGFTLHAELNWRVLVVTLGLSLIRGVLFGLAPALQLARPAVMPALKDTSVTERRARVRHGVPRPSATQALVVAQIAISLLLLVAAGLFVRTLANLQSIPLGFNRDNVLLFEVNAPQAGYPEDKVPAFYAELRRRLSEIPGVAPRDAVACLAHQGRQVAPDHRQRRGGARPPYSAGRAEFFHDDADSDTAGPGDRGPRSARVSAPVAVVSDLFARTYFGEEPVVVTDSYWSGRRRGSRIVMIDRTDVVSRGRSMYPALLRD
jgi:hypothetical protein